MIQAERPKLKHGLRNNVEFLGLYTSILALLEKNLSHSRAREVKRTQN